MVAGSRASPIMRIPNTNSPHRNGSIGGADTDELISLSLSTQIVCPYDCSHTFPLIEGLSQASLEGLRDREKAYREAIRKELEASVEQRISAQIAEREKTLADK